METVNGENFALATLARAGQGERFWNVKQGHLFSLLSAARNVEKMLLLR